MASETRTAEQAAQAAGCAPAQIVKSMVFQGQASGGLYLFLTSGSRRVLPGPAALAAGEELGRADADLVRAATGFAIGGVAPVGHLTPIPVWMDRHLTGFPVVWAAAGTPNHIFAIAPGTLLALTRATLADFSA